MLTPFVWSWRGRAKPKDTRRFGRLATPGIWFLAAGVEATKRITQNTGCLSVFLFSQGHAP